jgi:hypothetical protein
MLLLGGMLTLELKAGFAYRLPHGVEVTLFGRYTRMLDEVRVELARKTV